jgi:hypothetical protein
MRQSPSPSDRELVDLLSDGHSARIVYRRPYRYATSASLEELQVEVGGSEQTLILKELSRDRLIGGAKAAKPGFLHQPEREIETYRQILAPAGVGPRCLAAVNEADPARHWLLLEKVPGVELWQVGEFDVWEAVARWLGSFHSEFAQRLAEIRRANPHLLEYDAEWFASWRERAHGFLTSSDDPRAPVLARSLARYEEVIAAIEALPRTLVHGEMYPSNMLVIPDQRPVRVCPVDWEMAGVGPGLLDLAALVGGWSAAERERLVTAYRDGLGGGATLPAKLSSDLSCCRLHLALQWLAWAPGWRPPAEHAHDWLGEALELGRELGLR